MKWLWMLALVFVVGCNPAARCKVSSECGAGVCSGGFCADLSTIVAGDGGERSDQDGDDAGVATDGGVVDYDAGDNGRGP